MFTTTEMIAIGIVAVVLIYDFIIKPRIKGKLTKEQLDLIDYACETGVEYAEQLYINGENIDRNKVAMDYAFNLIKKSGILPERYMSIIKGMIEKKVYGLPPTHLMMK